MGLPATSRVSQISLANESRPPPRFALAPETVESFYFAYGFVVVVVAVVVIGRENKFLGDEFREDQLEG